MDFLIREASPDDAELIADLTCNAWAGKVAAGSSGHHETGARVLDDLRLGGGFILLVDNVAAGSVRWLPMDTEHDVWEIVRMGVTQAFRGQSLSQHLLEAVIHQALGCDVTELRLAVRTDQQRLIDFYAALGFELAPELEYSRDNQQEASLTVMRRVLRR